MKVIQNYKGMDELKGEMEVSNKKYKETLDTIRISFEKQLREYEKNRSKLSEKEKALTEQLLQHKQQQYTHYKEAIEKKTKEQQMEITQKLLAKLDTYMKRYAKENGYDFILGANSTANIIFAKETYDVTDDIIKAANAHYSKHE
jgi:outer membrane protein